MARRLGGKTLREGQKNLTVQTGGEEEEPGGELRDREQDRRIRAGGRIDGGRKGVAGLQADDLRAQLKTFGKERSPRVRRRCPWPASARIQPVNSMMFTDDASMTGQREASANVRLTASTARATSGPALIPGRGTKMNTPETRASTSRKA